MLKALSPCSATHIAQATGLRIYLLGPLRIERAGEALHLPRRKVESLLAYLLLHPEAHTRDQLATLFWGDSSDAQARHSLRTALATLRKEIAPDLLLVDREHLQLNPTFPVWVDLHELLAAEDLLTSAHSDLLQAKLALWQDELLMGFYDAWLTSEREYYFTRLLKLVLQVIQTLRARSDYAAAIEVAHQLLSFDPANEAAHQHLIFCYVAAGDRAAALRQYEQCVQALHDELDVLPMPTTTALYQWIKQQTGDEPSPAAKITNLTIPLTSFVGRTRAMATVKQLISPAVHTTRLLTLIGAGGSGKTRLAIQVATDLIDRFAHGVWWVELAALAAGEQVARAVAKALGVSEVRDESVIQSVINFVSDKQLLLVIDNCEHLVEPVAQLAADLLCHCPNLQILTTSREPLNIGGEIQWQVPPLTLPDPQQFAATDLLLHHESIRLFFERASAVQPGFHLTPENTPAVVEICTQLDGIPLAIELAAARVKVLAVEQIAARLTSTIGARFTLLTQSSRTALPRHQTLRAAVDWSYDLLDEAERTLFRQVAIFRGGFTLEAIEQVADLNAGLALETTHQPPATNYQQPITSHQPLDLLTQLVDKSLVIVEPQGGENRYRLLETLREYALEQYSTGGELKSLQQRHAEFFLRLAEQAKPQLTTPQQLLWQARLETELPNLRAALEYLIANADGELALRLTWALSYFLDSRGYISEGREWLRQALTNRGAASMETQAKVLDQAGFFAFRQGDYELARSSLEEAIFLFEQVENEIGIAESLQSLAGVDMNQGYYPKAQQRLEQSLNLCRSIEYHAGIGRALIFLGGLTGDQGKFAEARGYYLESLQVHQSIGDQVSIAAGFLNLGDTERSLGNLVAARTNFDKSLSMARTLGHKALIGISLQGLGEVVLDQEEYIQARRYGEEALHIARQLDNKSSIGFALATLGHAAHKLGESNKALAYYCQNLQLMQGIGYKWSIFHTLEEIAALLSEVLQHLEWAVRLLGAADSLRQETGIPVPQYQQTKYDLTSTTLRQQLGANAFNTLWQAGATTPLDQIVAEALRLLL